MIVIIIVVVTVVDRVAIDETKAVTDVIDVKIFSCCNYYWGCNNLYRCYSGCYSHCNYYSDF